MMAWRTNAAMFLVAVASLTLLANLTPVSAKYYDVNEEYFCERWNNWTKCSASCGGGIEEHRRNCRWKDFTENRGQHFVQKRTSSCNNYECPSWEQWTTWSTCPVSCGGGTSMKRRQCTGLSGCLGATVETRSCATEECPRWSEWTTWTACTRSCSGGTQNRKRACHHQVGGKFHCEGETFQERKCAMFFCPYWSHWSSWSACDVTCGKGTREMTRTCIRDPNGNALCDGPEKVVEQCTLPNCAVWSDWSDWSPCDVTCGMGKKVKERNCSNRDNSVGTCVGSATEAADCTLEECPRWSNWTAWSRCSARCGGGVQDRSRLCVRRSDNPLQCIGDSSEHRPCALYSCPFWGSWSNWSECSSTCGPGQETKTRPCHVAPGSGLSCDGSGVTSRSCTRPQCPYWHEWSAWTQCDASCDGGKKHTTRHCERLNGFDCHGPSNQTVICAPYPCPVWGNWTEWSACDQSCDGGTMRKTRSCMVDPESGFNCDGLSTDVQTCGQVPCAECTPDLLDCDFHTGLCNFTAVSSSPMAFYFRPNPRGFLETYAPFPKVGDWAELRSVAFRSCMAGSYCITVHQSSGGTGDHLSKNIVLWRQGTKEKVLWSRPNRPASQNNKVKFNAELHAGGQIILRVNQETKFFEYLWLYGISAVKGKCN